MQYALKNILFKEIITRPNALAIIGPVCSTISNAITDVSGLFNIPLVSFFCGGVSSCPTDTHSHAFSINKPITLCIAKIYFQNRFP